MGSGVLASSLGPAAGDPPDRSRLMTCGADVEPEPLVVGGVAIGWEGVQDWDVLAHWPGSGGHAIAPLTAIAGPPGQMGAFVQRDAPLESVGVGPLVHWLGSGGQAGAPLRTIAGPPGQTSGFTQRGALVESADADPLAHWMGSGGQTVTLLTTIAGPPGQARGGEQVSVPQTPPCVADGSQPRACHGAARAAGRATNSAVSATRRAASAGPPADPGRSVNREAIEWFIGSPSVL
jgi:hypothetical protein